jgi:hypothetical protein
MIVMEYSYLRHNYGGEPAVNRRKIRSGVVWCIRPVVVMLVAECSYQAEPVSLA